MHKTLHTREKPPLLVPKMGIHRGLFSFAPPSCLIPNLFGPFFGLIQTALALRFRNPAIKKAGPRLAFLTLFCLAMLQAAAQDEPCGVIPTPLSAEKSNLHQKAIAKYASRFSESYLLPVSSIPVQVHIIRRDDGSGGYSIDDWNSDLAELNAIYAPANMAFFECNPPNIITNDEYYDLEQGAETNALTSSYSIDKVMNVFIPGGDLLSSTGGSLCGYAYYPWSGIEHLVVKASCMDNGSTFPHEVGHFFGLYHTHGRTNGMLTDELVNSSNCTTAGDQVCDTPADPQLGLDNVTSSCQWNNTAPYTGGITQDANGDTFSPDPFNMMSYSKKSCRDFFSAGQYTRMSFYATTDRGNLSCNMVATPSNDVCNSAISVLNGSIITGSTSEATSMGAPDDCGTALDTGPGVWYKFTGTGGMTTVSLCNSSFDTKVGIFSGDCNDLICVDGSDDACGLQSEVIFESQPDVQYYIYITGFGANAGEFTLEFSSETQDDPCQRGLSINDNPLHCGIYMASDTITSSGMIPSDSTITFQAGQSITLRPGFHAAAGSNFVARIQDCTAGTVQPGDSTVLDEQPDLPTSIEPEVALPPVTSLSIAPNPFRNETVIRYNLQEKCQTQLTLFDMLGRTKVLQPGILREAGYQEYRLDGTHLMSGIYFVRLHAGDEVITQKVQVLKN